MRVLALDIGSVRTGLAISDPSLRVASPLCVLPADEVLQHAASFRRILEDWQPSLLLFGLPLTLGGDSGPQAQCIRAAAERIASLCNLPYEFADERLSTTQAKRSLHGLGLSERAMREKADMIAASLFLQAWLDARSAQDEGDAPCASGARKAAL